MLPDTRARRIATQQRLLERVRAAAATIDGARRSAAKAEAAAARGTDGGDDDDEDADDDDEATAAAAAVEARAPPSLAVELAALLGRSDRALSSQRILHDNVLMRLSRELAVATRLKTAFVSNATATALAGSLSGAKAEWVYRTCVNTLTVQCVGVAPNPPLRDSLSAYVADPCRELAADVAARGGALAVQVRR